MQTKPIYKQLLKGLWVGSTIFVLGICSLIILFIFVHLAPKILYTHASAQAVMFVNKQRYEDAEKAYIKQCRIYALAKRIRIDLSEDQPKPAYWAFNELPQDKQDTITETCKSITQSI